MVRGCGLHACSDESFTEPLPTATATATLEIDHTRYYFDGNEIAAEDVAYDTQNTLYYVKAVPQIASRDGAEQGTIGTAIDYEVDANGDSTIVEEVHLFSSWEAANTSQFVRDYGGEGDVAISIYARDVIGDTPDDQITQQMEDKVRTYADSVQQAAAATCLGLAFNLFNGTGDNVLFTTTPAYGNFNRRMSSVSTHAIAKWCGVYSRTWWRGDRVWFWTAVTIPVNMIGDRAFMNNRMRSSICL